MQTIRPLVWVIINDGSTDNTPAILKEYKIRYKWIKDINLVKSPRDIGLHLAEIMKKGFTYAIDFCEEKRLEYNYLGNVDADLTLPSTFFENLMNEFEKNPRLGIASGGTDHIIGNKKIRARLSKNEPSGGHMLILKACFEECGGMPISYLADSVLKAKAKLRGWITMRFEENIAIEIRDVDSAEGSWKGFVKSGKGSYYINHNTLHVAGRIIKYSIKRPYYGGIAYLAGYLGSLIERNKKIDDEEIRNYFWNKWRENLKSRNNGV